MLSATEFAGLSPSKLRLKEAEFFLEQLKNAGTIDHNATLFQMTAHFDAFLFCYVSIEEMLPAFNREKLKSIGVFRFFKALRNISTHHSILTGIKDSKFERPIGRVLQIGVGCHVIETAKFFLLPDKLRSIFDALLIERPRDKNIIDAARLFLDDIANSKQQIFLVELMQVALTEAAFHVV